MDEKIESQKPHIRHGSKHDSSSQIGPAGLAERERGKLDGTAHALAQWLKLAAAAPTPLGRGGGPRGRSGDYSAGEGGKANDILVTSKKEIDENNLQCNRFMITLLFWYLLINLVLYIC